MMDSYLTQNSDLQTVGENSFLNQIEEPKDASIGGFQHLYMPLVDVKDNIFREILDSVPAAYKDRIYPFFTTLAVIYKSKKNPNAQYVPIRVSESDENGITYDWIFENVRFMFLFNNDGNDSCSIVSFNPLDERLTSTIIPLDVTKYNEICSEIMAYIS